MRESSANIVYLKDYQRPDFLIDQVFLTVRLFEEGAEVLSRLSIRRQDDSEATQLRLDGEDLELRALSLDGVELNPARYQIDETGMTIDAVPETFELECTTWIKPQDNKRLEGLYKSSSMFCTQCEAEGFRRITYYLDRPDVLSVFTTRVEADKARYPLLLSNGNPVESGTLNSGRHFVTWEDPFPKPCYLFALVAGDLHCHQDRFVTQSGRDVDLRIYVEHKNSDKCDFALDCLKRSMRWDEEVYGREYDLDIFMIVAVDDFNMGAMENKGLNIFNSSCVLAKPETTTDAAYQRIEGIVAHEYFHNWSGNRVTCRDWFQLSLKEGFTVFRDTEFSSDMHSREVKRIEDVNFLRSAQFAEDAGPMSHPVRPASYMEISNFYTLTVYEKGAEIVRMLHTLLGAEVFRAGSDLYFERHDGRAVTTDDFVAAMEAVSGRDLTQFKRWYDQSGTPEIRVSEDYDAKAETYTLIFEQSCPPTPGQSKKQPFHIPLRLGLLDESGQDLPLSPAGGATDWVFELKEERETVRFENIAAKPVPSLLRGFSAPVKLIYDYSESDLRFLMSHDTDGFNRWDAGQNLALCVLDKLVADIQAGVDLSVSDAFVDAFRAVLDDASLDKATACKLLLLPAESYLIERAEEADVEAIHQAREFVRETLAHSLRAPLMRVYRDNHCAENLDPLGDEAMSRRALKNAVLTLLSADADADFIALARAQFEQADNMTDSISALVALVNSGVDTEADAAVQSFYERWREDAQVMEQWFSVQASSPVYTDLERIRHLMSVPEFSLTNPNKVRSVIGAYCAQNHLRFHDRSGSGYAFLADHIIELDDMNPQIASRLLTPLTRWRKFDSGRQEMILAQLKRIHGKGKLSRDVREVVEKSLP